MATKKRRWSGDPRLKTPQWKAIVQEWTDHITHTNQQGGAVYCQAAPCLLPGLPIRTGQPRTPAHLDVGHITPRITDPRQTWTIADTRPEHARCSRSAGRRIAATRNKARQQATPPTTFTINNDEW